MTPGLGGGRLASLYLLAVAARLLHLSFALDHPALAGLRADALVYDRWARAVAGGDLVGEGAWPTAPLYPYLLGAVYAVAGADRTVGKIATSLAGAAAAPLAAVVGLPRLGAAGATLGGAAVALYGPLVASDAALQKEGLAVVLLLAAVAAWDRSGRPAALAAGLLAGLAALVREFSPLAALGWAALDRRRSAALLAGAAIALAVPVARNLAVAGRPTPTSGRLGANLWIAHGPEAGVGFVPPSFWGATADSLDAAFAAEAERRGVESWTAEALGEVARRPGTAARRTLLRAWTYVRAFPREDFAGALVAPRLAPFGLVAPVGPGIAIPLGLAGLAWVLADAGRRRAWAPLLAVLAVFWLRTAILFPLERYRLPAAPVWILLAALALVRAREIGPARLVAAAAAAAAVSLAPLPGDLLEERAHERAALERLAEISRRAGRADDAERLSAALLDVPLGEEEDRPPVREP